jgi:hypothetical protein
MLAGHLAIALAGKRIEPRISLGTWMTAALLADLLFFVLLIAGIEHVRTWPGAASNRFLGDAPYSHSLLMDLLWAGLFAAGFFASRHDKRGAYLLFAAVLSHWVLDVFSHRPDMPLAPGVKPLLGFGLWNSFPLTLLIEGGAWLLAMLFYARATKAKSWIGALGFWIGVALFTISWLGNISAGIDPRPVRAGMNGLIFFALIIAWAFWTNRARVYLKTSSI